MVVPTDSRRRHERWLVGWLRRSMLRPYEGLEERDPPERRALQERGKTRHRPPSLRSPAGDLESRELKRRSISARAFAEACRILLGARARRASSPRAHFPECHRAPNKSGRRAARSPRLSDWSWLLVAFSLWARNSCSSYAYSSPSDIRLLLPFYIWWRAIVSEFIVNLIERFNTTNRRDGLPRSERVRHV